MTAQLPVTAAQLPPMTPLQNVQRSQQEIAAQRAQTSVLVETILDGYWQSDMSQKKRDLILMDWCDELEDWPVESVKAALRQWRRENPSKKPNPGHILQILNRAWGERHANQVRAVVQQLRAPEPLSIPDLNERQAICDDLAAKFPGLIKRVEPPKERASAEDVNAIQAEMRGQDG